MQATDRKRKRKYSLASDITEENPFTAKELLLMGTIYISCVMFLIIAYEYLMPVFNNPHYPYYNHVFDYTANVPMRNGTVVSHTNSTK